MSSTGGDEESIALENFSSPSATSASVLTPQEASSESGDYGLSVEQAKQIINGLDVFLLELSQRVLQHQNDGNQAFLDSYRRSLRRLRNLCERYGELPDRCTRPMLQYPRLESEYPIGQGGYADVYRATEIDETGERTVALKRLRTHVYGDKERLKKVFMREAALWSQLQHPNILPFVAVYIDLPKNSVSHLIGW
ncbi:hypothetical protein VNI00_007199 [Paramarasmius palmivorus]|uniref:Protein kinase domain-containing protein n=1 Tax=Paramarasmius palmivorus TaxID=297713 RepID=A0AAW0D6A9_9AGAR